MLPLENLWRPFLRGPLGTEARTSVQSKANDWAGIATINSGDTGVTVTTGAVTSGDLIRLTPASNTRQSSGVAAHLEVASIVDATSFDVIFADGVNHRAASTDVMWEIVKTSGS